VILHERLTPRDLAGCALMFAGLLVVQLPLLLRSPADPTPGPETESTAAPPANARRNR
jgi:hypothetical protein